MTGEQLYLQFKTLIREAVGDLKSYKRIDPHTIEMKTKSNKIYIFTYNGPDNFSFRSAKFKEEK